MSALVNRVVFGMSASRPVCPRIADIVPQCGESREAPPATIALVSGMANRQRRVALLERG
jgi:hypothetical protein